MSLNSVQEKCNRKKFLLRQEPLIPHSVLARYLRGRSIEILGGGVLPEIVTRQLLPDTIVVVDDSKVTEEDLLRFNFTRSDLGISKAEAAVSRIRSIFPIDARVVRQPIEADYIVVGPDYCCDEVLDLRPKVLGCSMLTSKDGAKFALSTPSQKVMVKSRQTMRAGSFAEMTFWGASMVHFLCWSFRHALQAQTYGPMAFLTRQPFRIGERKLVVVGAGGVGSNLAEAIVRMMPETELAIYEPDSVEYHNLNRQNYEKSDVGKKKVAALEKRLRSINRKAGIKCYPVSITQQNADQILKDFDLVFECVDLHRTKHVVSEACVKLSKPMISVGAAGEDGYVFRYSYENGPSFEELYPHTAEREPPSCAEIGVTFSSVLIATILQLVVGLASRNRRRSELYYVDFRLPLPEIVNIELRPPKNPK